MFEKILVCLDGSELAEQILPYATEQALRFGSRVVLLEVVRPSTTYVTPGVPGTSPGMAVFTDADVDQALREWEESKAYLDRVARRLRRRKLRVSPVTLTGPTGPAIVAYAQENGVDLIALATHGRSGVGRLVLGSVADYVVRKSNLPILITRPQYKAG
ncbi:MAG: universal stress protein [Chloroflexota bacterium]|nr:universal stress protein [Chloroflexota bacterium]